MPVSFCSCLNPRHFRHLDTKHGIQGLQARISNSALLHVVIPANISTKTSRPPHCSDTASLSIGHSHCFRAWKFSGFKSPQYFHSGTNILCGIYMVSHCLCGHQGCLLTCPHLSDTSTLPAFCGGYITLLICCPSFWSLHFILSLHHAASPCTRSALLSGNSGTWILSVNFQRTIQNLQMFRWTLNL